MSSPLTAGTLLSGCYRLQGILARGEFGFIYMAVNQNHAEQPCILEEFWPADHQLMILPQLRDCFQTAIADLTQLQHPQILRLQGMISDAQRLFLVQDDIAANTCREVLNERFAQGQTFSETEVRQFFTAILPVLAYLHDRGICHSNLSLDSILLQETNQLPILSNFGQVRKLAIEQQFPSRHPAQSTTWLAAQLPPTPASDLYDLATVVLALLTGRALPEGQDPHQWMNWRNLVSPPFARLLRRMLLPASPQRFSSAPKLLLALRSLEDKITLPPSIHPIPTPTITQPVETSIHRVSQPIHPASQPIHRGSQPIHPASALLRSPANTPHTPVNSPQSSPAPNQRDYSLPILTAIFISLLGLVTWRITNLAPKPIEANPTAAIALASPTTEDQMQADLRDRQRQLGIRYPLFIELVDELFYAKHPEWVNRSLTPATSTALKAEWQQMATTVLTRLATLSPESRQDMGDYNRASYDRWLATLHPPLTRQIIESQTDAKFFNLFPEQRGKTPNPRKSGQVWYAIARDTINPPSPKK